MGTPTSWTKRVGAHAAVAVAIGAFFARTATSVPPVQAAPQTVVQTAGLHVVGSTLENSSGQVVIPWGVHRQSWDYYCVNPWGASHDGTADQTEVNAMLAWHINTVRIALNEDCWLGINGVSENAATFQSDLLTYVNLLTSNNIIVSLDLAFTAPGTTLSGPVTDQYPMPDMDHSPTFWTQVATAYKSNSRVIFEPFNEPFPDKDNSASTDLTTTAGWQCWKNGGTCPHISGFPDYQNAGMQTLVTTIRNTGATNVIALNGGNWGSDVSQWLTYEPTDALHALIAGWHSYGDGLSCQDLTCWNSTLAPLITHVPLLADEIGELDCAHSYIDQVMSFLDSKGQGYIPHAWGPYTCTTNPALTTDWAGTPTQTYGQGYHDHLAALWAAGSSYKSTVLADGPVAYWRLDEASGTTAADQLSAHPGTYTAGPTLAQSGALVGDSDTAIKTNGSSQYVSIPYSAALNTAQFSVEVWAYPTAGSGSYRGVMASRYYPKGWVLYAGSGNAWEFWINSGSGMTTLSGGTVTLSTWAYLAATFDGTTARLYVNGTQVASATISGYTPQTTSAAAVGQSEPGAGFFFPGKLDEPAIYNKALTATQVANHWHTGSGR